VLSPNGKVAIFFTGNGTLLGKSPIFPHFPRRLDICVNQRSMGSNLLNRRKSQ
jgi:hypothetical protein